MKTTSILLSLLLLAFHAGINAQDYRADVQGSVLEWTGQKVTGKHFGNIELGKGMFSIKGSTLVSADFEVDMTTITNTDLENEEYNQKLVGHLKSDDFFGVETHPTARFVLSKPVEIIGGNALVRGDLTIKGITHPAEFKAVIDHSGETAKVYGNLVIDRTLYDVKYGSGKFFSNLADNTIYDEFTLTLNISAPRVK